MNMKKMLAILLSLGMGLSLQHCQVTSLKKGKNIPSIP